MLPNDCSPQLSHLPSWGPRYYGAERQAIPAVPCSKSWPTESKNRRKWFFLMTLSFGVIGNSAIVTGTCRESHFEGSSDLQWRVTANSSTRRSQEKKYPDIPHMPGSQKMRRGSEAGKRIWRGKQVILHGAILGFEPYSEDKRETLKGLGRGLIVWSQKWCAAFIREETRNRRRLVRNVT